MFQLVPDPLNNLLEEDILDLGHKLFVTRVHSLIIYGVQEDSLNAEEVYFVDIVDQEEVVRWVNHWGLD